MIYIYKNVRFSNDLITNFAFQYSEILQTDSIALLQKLVAFGRLQSLLSFSSRLQK
jgi:hypothetical protein